MLSRRCTCGVPTPRWRATTVPAEHLQFSVEPFEQERDLDGILLVEEESFTNPWTRAMYTWELQNPEVCHIYVVRTPECRVAGFCAFWLVVDEVHVNNVALRPAYRAKGLGSALMRRVLTEARRLGALRATLEVRASNLAARRFYEAMGFEVTATRPRYYTDPTEDALILWRELT
jgi:ribosomal-protein-alanine N-acetyltransferase